MSPSTGPLVCSELMADHACSGELLMTHDSCVKILIADDDALVRDALKKLLEKEQDFRVVGMARNGSEIQDQLAGLNPDLLLLDLNMRRESGLEIMRSLNGSAHKVRVILLTACVENGEVVEALRLGARGVVMKNTASQLLYKGIRAVISGEYWIDHKSVSDLVHALQVAPVPARNGGSSNSFGLTPRELDILRAIMDGCTNRDIAQKCSISAQTVKHHLTSIFQKVGVSNRLELSLFAMNNHLTLEC
jgi:two-component system nitrate/nitrite response regulator NarL